MHELNRSRKVFAVIIVMAIITAILASVIGYSQGKKAAFDGELEDIGLFEVDGELQTAKLFCSSPDNCKWLWLIEVTGDPNGVDEFRLPYTDLPEVGDFITIEVPDSRANLFVSTEPIATHDSGVRIDEHAITQIYVTVVIREDLSQSSGLPEYVGVPK